MRSTYGSRHGDRPEKLPATCVLSLSLSVPFPSKSKSSARGRNSPPIYNMYFIFQASARVFWVIAWENAVLMTLPYHQLQKVVAHSRLSIDRNKIRSISKIIINGSTTTRRLLLVQRRRGLLFKPRRTMPPKQNGHRK